MASFLRVLLLVVPLSVFVLWCAGRSGAAPKDTPLTDPVVNEKQFHERLLKIAEIYPVYGRVDDESRWAPELCRLPNPPKAAFSKSADESTHGQKLYSLFARNRWTYFIGAGADAPGQVIIKESWVPVELKEKPKDLGRPGRGGKAVAIKPPADLAPLGRANLEFGGGPMVPYAEKGGKWYKADRRGELFIMMKLDPKTPGTDQGWVYGTVSADGKTVTSAGKVASCMKCHQTKTTRLFGLKSGDGK